MSFAREMLDTTPAGVDLGVAEVAAAIDACSHASQACTSCADACLAEDDVAPLRACIALDHNCADVCAATARILSRPLRSDHLVSQLLLQACVRACASCAEECDGMPLTIVIARYAPRHVVPASESAPPWWMLRLSKSSKKLAGG